MYIRFAVFVLVLLLTAFSAAVPAAASDDADMLRLVNILRAKGVIDDADVAELMRPESPGSDKTLGRKLVKVLYEKGVLDETSFAELSGMGPEEAAVSVDSGAAAGQKQEAAASVKPAAETTVRDAVPAIDKGLSAVETGVAKLGRDNVSMKINLFFQGGWVHDDAGFSVGTPPTSDYSRTAGNQFSVRRARIYFSGNVLEKLGYKVSFETASSTILRDAYAYLDYIPYARITVGQFKVPFGYEGPLALAELPLANRSMVTNLVHAPKLRDRGVMLSGTYKFREGDDPLSASYYAAVVNGNGFNTSDNNSHKDVALRVRLNPMLSCITVGGSYYLGKNMQANGNNERWERWGAEVDWRPKYVKGLKVLGEYLWNKQYYDTYASRSINFTTALPALGRKAESEGWYVLAAYRVHGLDGMLRYLNGLEPVARFAFLDEDTMVSDNERRSTTLGLNYYLAKDTRLMLNYELIHADGRLKARSLQKIDTLSHRVLTTLLQIKF